MTSNKRKGTAFEAEMCKILSDMGYWVHNFADRKNGQPVDLIACGFCTGEIADCKVCEQGFFDTRRIEENQELAMRKWLRCHNEVAAIYFKLPDGAIHKLILKSEKQLDEVLAKKRLTEDEIRALPGWNGRYFDYIGRWTD